VLLDLGGVVYVGSTPIAGATAAIGRLRGASIPVRFITNTTRRSRRQVIADLAQMGLDVSAAELLTPAVMARAYLQRQGLSPFLLVHPDLEEDFAEYGSGARQAVVVGDAGEHFTYDRLNCAYRKLVSGAPLLALAKNRNFKDKDGELSLDAGPFVAALEYASKAHAVLLGKPSADFFELAIDGMGCERSETVMIGDDAEADVGGAMAAGLQTVLVRTGKYQAGDEGDLAEPPQLIARDLTEAIAWVLERC
jgi:HAD superfamily hydrolase (TIGR01458 family)